MESPHGDPTTPWVARMRQRVRVRLPGQTRCTELGRYAGRQEDRKTGRQGDRETGRTA